MRMNRAGKSRQSTEENFCSATTHRDFRTLHTRHQRFPPIRRRCTDTLGENTGKTRSIENRKDTPMGETCVDALCAGIWNKITNRDCQIETGVVHMPHPKCIAKDWAEGARIGQRRSPPTARSGLLWGYPSPLTVPSLAPKSNVPRTGGQMFNPHVGTRNKKSTVPRNFTTAISFRRRHI